MSMTDDDAQNSFTPDGAQPGMPMPLEQGPATPESNNVSPDHTTIMGGDVGAPPYATNMAQQSIGEYAAPAAQAVGNAGSAVAKRILSYLGAENAADPESAKKFVDGVKHEYPGINDDDANVIAVHKAYELGGPQAAVQMLQFNRGAYNAKAAFATAAMTGNGDKPPDPRAAADAATQASTHVLDGSSVKFTPSRDGFTVTVKQPGSDNAVTRNLTPEQFMEVVNVGKTGQYDRLFETGGYGMAIAKIAGAQGYYPGGPKTQEDADKMSSGAQSNQNLNPQEQPLPTDPYEPEGNTPPKRATDTPPTTGGDDDKEAPDPEDLPIPGRDAEPGYHPGEANPWDKTANRARPSEGDEGAIPGTHDANGHWLGPIEPSRYAKKYEDESNGIYGRGNVGNERSRQKYMADRRLGDEREKDKLDQARATQDAKKEIAYIGADAKRDTQHEKTEGYKYVADKQAAAALEKQQKFLEAQLLRMSNQHNDAVMREEGRNAREEIRQLGIAKPGEIDKILEKHHLTREQLGLGPEPKFKQPPPQQDVPQQPPAPAQSAKTPSAPRIQALKDHPEMRDDFDNMYGPGAAEKILGPKK